MVPANELRFRLGSQQCDSWEHLQLAHSSATYYKLFSGRGGEAGRQGSGGGGGGPGENNAARQTRQNNYAALKARALIALKLAAALSGCPISGKLWQRTGQRDRASASGVGESDTLRAKLKTPHAGGLQMAPIAEIGRCRTVSQSGLISSLRFTSPPRHGAASSGRRTELSQSSREWARLE